MRFTLNGQQFELTAEDVQDRLGDVSPESVHEYGVQIGSVRYPVKQAFEAATGIPRRRFTTQVARRQLAALGFRLWPKTSGARLQLLRRGTPEGRWSTRPW